MAGVFKERLSHAWNAFMNRAPTSNYDNSQGSGRRPYHQPMRFGNERSIVSAIYNRIAMGVAAVDIQHVRLDQDGRYYEQIPSNLNDCLKVRANIDQTGCMLIQDIALSMCDEGVVAVVPVDTTFDITKTNSYDILSMRVGKIVEWFPDKVRIELYNDRNGIREQIILPKDRVAIIENPLYDVMNEQNSIAKRLIHKLNLMDSIDEKSVSTKLDLIIHLPYVIKTKAREEQAKQRMSNLEGQLANSKYGIAYTDGSERVTQLNRAVDNNLMPQIQYLTSMLYSQLGMTENVFNGTAEEAEMLNYYNRTIEPLGSSSVVVGDDQAGYNSGFNLK